MLASEDLAVGGRDRGELRPTGRVVIGVVDGQDTDGTGTGAAVDTTGQSGGPATGDRAAVLGGGGGGGRGGYG